MFTFWYFKIFYNKPYATGNSGQELVPVLRQCFPWSHFLPSLAHSCYTPASFTGGHNTRALSKQTTENLPLITRYSRLPTLDNNIPLCHSRHSSPQSKSSMMRISHNMPLSQFFFIRLFYHLDQKDHGTIIREIRILKIKDMLPTDFNSIANN